MKLLSTILLSLISFSALSQSGGIKGIVTNPLEKTGFPGLEITILKGDSLVVGTITGSEGDYKISNVKIGTYNLKLRFIGYRESLIKDIKINENRIDEINLLYPDTTFHVKRICPQGHADNIIPIVYGLPGKKLMKLSGKGKVWLGGCVVTGYDPVWYCKTHKIEF